MDLERATTTRELYNEHFRTAPLISPPLCPLSNATFAAILAPIARSLDMTSHRPNDSLASTTQQRTRSQKKNQGRKDAKRQLDLVQAAKAREAAQVLAKERRR